MQPAHATLTCCNVRTDLVSHEHGGGEAVLFEQAAHRRYRRRLFRAFRAPEPDLLVGNDNDHLVESHRGVGRGCH
jgi:hypothetical protein